MALSRTLAHAIALVAIAITACGPAAPPATSPPVAKTESQAATEVPKVESKAAPKAAEVEAKPAQVAPTQAAAAKPSSKDAEAMVKYEALVQAAKKEGKIAVNGSYAFLREALRDSFGNKFGIDVEYLHLDPSDVVNRLKTERQAGQYNLDAILTGPGAFIISMIPEGMIDRLDDVLILPEVVDPSKWLDGKIPWSDPEHRVLRLNKYVQSDISINTSIVKKGEIKVFRDLLDPKWKGKIAAQDPTVLGAGGVLGSFLLLTFGEEFVKQLYLGQEVVFSRDFRQMGDWLARGRYPVVVWGSDPAEMRRMQKEGLPVEAIVAEDAARISAGWGAIGMLNRAPHPNAARLLVNWLASKEGQEAWVKISGWPVTRAGVDQSALPDYLKLKPGAKYVDIAGYEYITTQRAPAQTRVRELIQR